MSDSRSARPHDVLPSGSIYLQENVPVCKHDHKNFRMRYVIFVFYVCHDKDIHAQIFQRFVHFFSIKDFLVQNVYKKL